MPKFRHLYEKLCLDCGQEIIGVLQLSYCPACKQARDRARAIGNWRKDHPPGQAKMGRPRVYADQERQLQASTVSDERDKSNRPIKLTCKYGHPFDGVDARGRRICKTCRRIGQRQRRQTEMAVPAQVPVTLVDELRWPYGASDPLSQAIAKLLPYELPEEVRADAGQQVYLEMLEQSRIRVAEGSLRGLVQRAIKDNLGSYALSLDWQREDGFALADMLAGEDVYA